MGPVLGLDWTPFLDYARHRPWARPVEVRPSRPGVAWLMGLPASPLTERWARRREDHQRSTRCSRPGGGSYGSGQKSVTLVIWPPATSKKTIASELSSPSVQRNSTAAW